MPYQLASHDRHEMPGLSTAMTPSKSSPLLDDRLHSPEWAKRGSYSPLMLTVAHVQEALAASEDHGSPLDFMKKSLVDIEAAAAEQLAAIGSRAGQAESRVERCAYPPALLLSD